MTATQPQSPARQSVTLFTGQGAEPPEPSGTSGHDAQRGTALT